MERTNFELSPGDRAAYEKLPSAMAIFHCADGGYRLLLASDGLCGLLGADRPGVTGPSDAEPLHFVFGDDRALALEAGRSALSGGEYRAAFRLASAGGPVWTACSGRARRLEDGSSLLFLSFSEAPYGAGASGQEGFGPGVAELRRAQERYDRELMYLRQNSDYYLISKWRSDLTANTVLEYDALSERALKLTAGRSFDETAAAVVSSPYSADDRAKLSALLDRQTLIRLHGEGDTRFSAEYRRDQNGLMPFWVSVVINTFKSPSGHVECFVYAYDVTEKTLEAQIISRLTMLGYDLLGLLYVQTRMCRYFRIKKMKAGKLFEHFEDYQSSIDEDVDRIIVPDQRDNVRTSLRYEKVLERLDENDIYSFSYSMISADGTIKQKLLQFMYLDENRDTIFFCKSDITRQYQQENEQIERLREAKLEADRANSAKSVFLSSMSHDLRTPLNGVIGFTNLALRDTDPEKKQAYLQNVLSSGELLLALVNDTLELSRIESGKYTLEPEAVELRELLTPVVTALRPSAEVKGLTLQADAANYPADAVWADRLKLQKVFLNLLSNAVKYTPAGGRVSARAERLDPPVGGCNYRITVSDDGIGMDADFLPRIFEPFSQEHRPEAADVVGTGLGLAIVKRIVDLMGGRISVESALGRGSAFTVDLPLAPADGSLTEGKSPSRDFASLAGRRILLCEDNYMNTEIAKILLEEQGMTVICAKNGREGAETFASSAPGEFDAVLMDIRMPVMDGYEAARQIRSAPRADAGTVPIIAMTADAFEEDILHSRQAGMDGYVTKPIDPEKLMAAIRERINQTA